MFLASKAEAKAKAKANEIATTADHLGIARESAPAHKRAKTKASDAKDNVITAVRRAIPRGNAPKAKKEESQREKETATRGQAKDRGVWAKEFGK